MVWFWTVCPECGRKKQRIEWQLPDDEYERLSEETRKLCYKCYIAWKFLRGVKGNERSRSEVHFVPKWIHHREKEI